MNPLIFGPSEIILGMFCAYRAGALIKAGDYANATFSVFVAALMLVLVAGLVA